ncbi:MAG: hypothetical protein U1F25_08645 [Rubrivivax sp.]
MRASICASVRPCCLGSGTEQVLRLDDERMAFQLHNGELAVRVPRSGRRAGSGDARSAPAAAARHATASTASATPPPATATGWRATCVDDARRLTAGTGQRLELFREARTGELRHVWRGISSDDAPSRAGRSPRTIATSASRLRAMSRPR